MALSRPSAAASPVRGGQHLGPVAGLNQRPDSLQGAVAGGVGSEGRGRMKLTLRPTINFSDGPGHAMEPVQFEVVGLPANERALIGYPPGWRALHIKNGIYGEWSADFDSQESALAAIALWDRSSLLPHGYTPDAALRVMVQAQRVSYHGFAYPLKLVAVTEFPAPPLAPRHLRVTASSVDPDGRPVMATVGLNVDKFKDPTHVAEQLAAAMKGVVDGSLRPGDIQILS